jgi:hypothetical protein
LASPGTKACDAADDAFRSESVSTAKKLNLSTIFAVQAVGIKKVHDDIWLVGFMDYDLGYFDLETRVLEPLENPFGPKVLPTVLGTLCNPCPGPNPL